MVQRAEQTGKVPAGEQIAAEYRLAPDVANLVSSLAAVGVDRRAKGLPTDLDKDWRPPFEHADDDPADDIDVPLTDPWTHAVPVGPTTFDHPEPIGPDPAPADDRTEALRGAMAVRGALLTPRTDPADTCPDGTPAPELTTAVTDVVAEPSTEATTVGHPGTPDADKPARRPVVWPVVLMALGAFVAVWSGWVGLGKLTGFGKVDLLPGIVEPGSWATIDSAITLPIGVEAYAAYALYVWLSGRVPTRARTFAKWSALASLAVGALGQVAYHLLVAYGVTAAPWWITTLVSCLPVAVLGMGAALAHLVREDAR
nr:ABC transporter permease [Micromonospora sp. KC721]